MILSDFGGNAGPHLKKITEVELETFPQNGEIDKVCCKQFVFTIIEILKGCPLIWSSYGFFRSTICRDYRHFMPTTY